MLAPGTSVQEGEGSLIGFSLQMSAYASKPPEKGVYSTGNVQGKAKDQGYERNY